MKNWGTFNEPVIFCIYGYATLAHAPMVESPGIGEYLCTHNVLLSHARVYHMYRDNYYEQYKGKVGIVLNSGMTWPKDANKPADVAAADRSIQFWVSVLPYLIYSVIYFYIADNNNSIILVINF